MGLNTVDCAQTPSTPAHIIYITPSLQDLTQCSSEYCPERRAIHNVAVVIANPAVISKRGIKALAESLTTNLPNDCSPCLQPFGASTD